MKSLLLIPAVCLACFSCSTNCCKTDKCCDGVQSQETSSDWSITTKVKSEILADTSISAYARFVSVNTTNGVVTLTGTVSTKEDKEKIGRIARNVRGVMRVDNQITVSNK